MAAMHIKAGTKRVFGAPNVLRASTVLLAVQKVYYVGCFAGHPVSLMVKVCPPFCPLKDIPSTRCSEQMMHFLVHLKHPGEGPLTVGNLEGMRRLRSDLQFLSPTTGGSGRTFFILLLEGTTEDCSSANHVRNGGLHGL